MLSVKRFVCGPLENNVYVVVNDAAGCCAIIDPAPGSARVLAHVEKQALAVRYLLLTHGHFDHVFALAEFHAKFGAPIALHPGDREMYDRLPETAAQWGVPDAQTPPPPDILLEHGQVLDLDGAAITVRHTPGHSPGQVAFVLPGHALVGDTLFRRGIGRWDLPGADYHTLERSIREQLYTLPPETVVWPGHGPETTIDEEIQHNPYIGDGARFTPKI
jgi:hydroxyacylglutathione hydrolase